MLGPNHSSADRKRLRADLKYYLDTVFAEVKATLQALSTTEGYGRTDALARIPANLSSEAWNWREQQELLVVGNAPVNYPPVCGSPSVSSRLGAVQRINPAADGKKCRRGDWACTPRINLLRDIPGVQFAITIRVDGLQQIEDVLGGAKARRRPWSPKWPWKRCWAKSIAKKAAAGGQIYQQLCGPATNHR